MQRQIETAGAAHESGGSSIVTCWSGSIEHCVGQTERVRKEAVNNLCFRWKHLEDRCESHLHLLSGLGLLCLLFVLRVNVDSLLTNDFGLLDGKFFVGLDLDLASLLDCLLFDEGHLQS